MIKNNEGKVALKWALPHRNAPPNVVIKNTDRHYHPIYQWNIAMIWVHEADVQKLLEVKEKTCNCNNGTWQKAFVPASELDVNLWKSGNREGVVR